MTEMSLRRKDKYLENFDPEKSTRERRKLTRKLYNMQPGRKQIRLYDSEGLMGGKDLCDCGDQTCPGCHFPCQKCSSLKCATECRVNRKWAYIKCDIEGTSN